MNPKYKEILKSKMNDSSYEKLTALDNEKLFDFVGMFAEHCNPESIYVCDDSAGDEEYVRRMAIEKGEERPLKKKGQTIHFDGYKDQARDRTATRYIVYKENLERMHSLNSVEYEREYAEIMEIAKNNMQGKDALVRFFCKGPTLSDFSIPCVQFTDSWYVAHSEQILYRKAYEHFRQMKDKDKFYRLIHSAGELIVGDDIAYFRNIEGEFRAVNVEQGIFGIIRDVNLHDDPAIFENLQKPQEIIFSNVLIGPDENPYWIGMGIETPTEGENHSGTGWTVGKKDAEGKEITLAHSNARYTMHLDYLENFDRDAFDEKKGIKVEGLIYGGRDSDTTVPVEESRSYRDGILLKAATLESETTSATLGAEGIRRIDPMANLDFLSYPLGEKKTVRFTDRGGLHQGRIYLSVHLSMR